jgi:hypothetical protein
MSSNKQNEIEYRDKYSTAIQLLTYEGQVAWSRYNAMVTAQSIFIAIVVGILVNRQLVVFIPFLSLMAILICFFWLVMTIRNFAMLKYYILCARELEEKIWPPNKDLYYNFFKRGDLFRENRTVEFVLNEDPKKYHKRPDMGRLIDTNWAAYFIICLFIILHLLIILLYFRL